LAACSSTTSGDAADSGTHEGDASASAGGAAARDGAATTTGGTSASGGTDGPGGASASGGTDGSGGGTGSTGNLDAAIDARVVTAPLSLGAVLMFDSSCPAGYAELTDLRDRYVRGHDGDTDRAETGGYASHTHDLGAHDHVALEAGSEHVHPVTLGNPTPTLGNDVTGSLANLSSPTHRHTGTASDLGGGPHTHTIPSSQPQTTEPADNLPSYREFVFCRLELPEANVPRNAMVLSGATCQAGFDEVLDARNRLLRGHDGDDRYGEAGGSDQHTHGFPHDHGGITDLGGRHNHGGSTTNSPDFVTGQRHADEQNSSAPSHKHTISLAFDEHQHAFSGASALGAADSFPNYHEVTVCQATEQSPVASGTLVLYDDVACPEGFSEKADFRDRFLRGNDGDDTYGERSGSDMHDHDTAHNQGGLTETVSHNHNGTATVGGADSTIITARCCRGSEGPRSAATGGHTHGAAVGAAEAHAHAMSDGTPSITMSSNVPTYRELIVCEKD
jgi:hypothetical protein